MSRTLNKKKVRKPYNKHVREQRKANQLVVGYGVATVVGRKVYHIVDLLETPQIIPTIQIQATALTEFAHKWSILIAAFGIDDFGQRYFKSEQLFISERKKQHDLAAGLNDYHQQFLTRAMNPKHLAGAGWIGSPEGRDIDEQQAGAIFQLIGAWD